MATDRAAPQLGEDSVPAPQLRYNPALDGLRAFAVAGVIAQHIGYVVAGYFGVTVFFVISGYLITSLLIAEHDRSGRIGIAGFYRRRFARLAPALLLVTATVTVWLLAVGEPFRTWWAGLVGALTYSTDLILTTPSAGHVSTYYEWSWSLGIEEQFYLIWPLVMIVLLRRRLGRVALAVAAASVVVGAWVIRDGLSHGTPTHSRLHFSFDVHMDAIAIGALMALALTGRTISSAVAVRIAAQLACVAGAVGLVAAMRSPGLTHRWVQIDAGGYGQVAAASALVVLGVVVAPSGPFARLLGNRVLVHVGRLSYGLYLWNILLVYSFERATGHLPAHSGFALAGWVVVLLGVAELSFRFVEQPLRHRWSGRPPAQEQADAQRGAVLVGS